MRGGVVGLAGPEETTRDCTGCQTECSTQIPIHYTASPLRDIVLVMLRGVSCGTEGEAKLLRLRLEYGMATPLKVSQMDQRKVDVLGVPGPLLEHPAN